MEAFKGDLHLGIMKGGEDFWPIGSDKQNHHLLEKLHTMMKRVLSAVVGTGVMVNVQK